MEEEEWTALDSGAILVGTGMSTLAQIPVPGHPGMTISFWTNDTARFVNRGVAEEAMSALADLGIIGERPTRVNGRRISTSTLFIQDPSGRKVLRLDYDYNKVTGQIDYHWNQKSVHAKFGIPDHAPAGRSGTALHRFARGFRHLGRGFVVAGVVMDGVAIYQASNRPRKVAEVVGGWAGAWAGCKVVGAGGALAGSAAPGIGTAAGGVGGCIVGGIGGYFAGSWAGGEIYDLGEDVVEWAEDTLFTPAEPVPVEELLAPAE